MSNQPFSQGRPVWVDDRHFNPRFQSRHTALPRPGGDEELKRLAGRVFSQSLDRARPLVPVSVRADFERGALGNKVAAIWAPLPVGIGDPVERLDEIRLAMAGIKESGQAVGAQALTHLAGFAALTILAQAARLQARQRMFNHVITNFPGPQQPRMCWADNSSGYSRWCRWQRTPSSGSQ